MIYEGLNVAINNFKIFIFGNGFGTSFLLIDGYYWSGTKYANYHSQYITILVESGIFSILLNLIFTLLIPIFNKSYNYIFPLVIGLFFYNIFYQIILEPIYWFIIFTYYYESVKKYVQ